MVTNFFAKRQLVTLFSAPNYCGEFDNAGAMMSVDETLMCSFQILKPAEKKAKGAQQPAQAQAQQTAVQPTTPQAQTNPPPQNGRGGRPLTPPRKGGKD